MELWRNDQGNGDTVMLVMRHDLWNIIRHLGPKYIDIIQRTPTGGNHPDNYTLFANAILQEVGNADIIKSQR